MLDKFQGILFCLVYGDAYGAKFEGGFLERCLWKIIGNTGGKLRYTDDTQMSLDIINEYLATGLLGNESLAHRFAKSYKWSRGYGSGTTNVLRNIARGSSWQEASKSVYKDGSFGNGAAMRAPAVALCFPFREALRKSVISTSKITHSNNLAIEGAILIAFSTLLAMEDEDTSAILNFLYKESTLPVYKEKITYCIEALNKELDPKEVITTLGNKVTATESCITAIYFAFLFRDSKFLSMINKICACKGDTDTIGAMAGAIWGGFNGYSKLDISKMMSVEGKNDILTLAKNLYQKTMF